MLWRDEHVMDGSDSGLGFERASYLGVKVQHIGQVLIIKLEDETLDQELNLLNKDRIWIVSPETNMRVEKVWLFFVFLKLLFII
jgi:hypothetical protein